MIFNKWYKENKELKEEVDYYAKECWRKEARIRNLNRKIRELEKEVLKNENFTKGKDIELPNKK